MSNKIYSQKLNIAVIFGGKSGEHEVSLASAIGVINSLDKEKYNIIPIAITKKGNWLIGDKGKEYLKLNSESIKESGISIEQSQSLVITNQDQSNLTNFMEGETGYSKIDLVIPIIHGNYGEDGKLQGMLEMLDLPYLFSDTLASALAMNKLKSKIIVKEAGLDVAKHIILHNELSVQLEIQLLDIDNIIKKLSLPIVVKPIESGSSVGIFISKTKDDLCLDIKEASKHGQIMLEEYKIGRELTVGVIGDDTPEVLAVTEIVPKKSGFYDYKSKYEDGGSEHICPAKIPDDILSKIKDSAIKAYTAIGARDLARVDFIWNQEDNKIHPGGTLYFLEINTIPGMTSSSIVPEQAKAVGMNFSEFLDKLIGLRVKSL